MRVTGRAIGACMLLAFALAGCPKSSDDGTKPAPSASAAASIAAPQASAAPAASGAAAGPGTGGAAAASFAGTYSLAPAAMYIPDHKDWERVKQAKDDPSKLVGDGALAIAVDGSGRVSGTIDTGPAGPAVIDGSLVDGEIRGLVRRKDPSDNGLTGTIVATRSGDELTGKLSLAEANAAIVREGKITMKKK